MWRCSHYSYEDDHRNEPPRNMSPKRPVKQPSLTTISISESPRSHSRASVYSSLATAPSTSAHLPSKCHYTVYRHFDYATGVPQEAHRVRQSCAARRRQNICSCSRAATTSEDGNVSRQRERHVHFTQQNQQQQNQPVKSVTDLDVVTLNRTHCPYCNRHAAVCGQEVWHSVLLRGQSPETEIYEGYRRME